MPTYREDLRLLISLIPEEVQDDSTYYAAQRLLSLVEKAEENGDSGNPEA